MNTIPVDFKSGYIRMNFRDCRPQGSFCQGSRGYTLALEGRTEIDLTHFVEPVR